MPSYEWKWLTAVMFKKKDRFHFIERNPSLQSKGCVLEKLIYFKMYDLIIIIPFLMMRRSIQMSET